MNTDDHNNIFGPEGAIARAMTGYEARPQQTQMYDAINKALSLNKHIVIEAGTGVGKTFAYLIPVIKYAVTSKKPVIISTNTINLQEQILYKDIPFLRKALGLEFTAALCKGRSNYICRRRLAKTWDAQGQLFDGVADLEELGKVYRWAQAKTESDGSLSALTWVPSDAVWSKVCAEHDNCAGKKCDYFNSCFYQRARQKLHHCNIVIVNHPVLVIDSALREDKANFLPKYEVAVIDEGHRIENIAQEHLGLEISNDQVHYLLNTLCRPDRTGTNWKGFLAPLKGGKVAECRDAVQDARVATDEFFADVQEWANQKMPKNGRIKDKSAIAGLANTLTPALNKLYLALKELALLRKGKETKKTANRTGEGGYDDTELEAYAKRTLNFASGVESFWNVDNPNHVYWLEIKGRKRPTPRVILKSAPLKVNQILKEMLFDHIKTAILTSATLACTAPLGIKARPKQTPVREGSPFNPNGITQQNDIAAQANPPRQGGTNGVLPSLTGRAPENLPKPVDPLSYIKTNLGLEDAMGLVLGSPFDYQQQVKMHIIKNMPDPREDGFEFAASKKIMKYLNITNGRAFVLFTSYSLMDRVYERINNELTSKGIPSYIQGKSMPRHKMLEQFKSNIGSVIFGADSFWQGVDVPGEALENIIITKLPFPVPSTPLIEARIEEMEKAGLDSFMNYFLPEAILKLRQGFGRLIRSKTDKGIVVILDSRILNKNYGRFFLDSLPKCPVLIEDSPD